MLRALLALLAIVVCGWFAVGVRQAQDTDRATTLLSAGNRIDPGPAAHVASLLHAAELLNPDRQVDLLRAQLDDERGARRQAERVLRAVVAAEPLNAQAWALVARSASSGATLRLAYAKLEYLVRSVRTSH